MLSHKIFSILQNNIVHIIRDRVLIISAINNIKNKNEHVKNTWKKTASDAIFRVLII